MPNRKSNFIELRPNTSISLRPVNNKSKNISYIISEVEHKEEVEREQQVKREQQVEQIKKLINDIIND
tara:strand:- start:560 stop:763 length:204 start_codon:yes stop_codon:yes gene_type:complete